jgi:hypothetical protein
MFIVYKKIFSYAPIFTLNLFDIFFYDTIL